MKDSPLHHLTSEGAEVSKGLRSVSGPKDRETEIGRGRGRKKREQESVSIKSAEGLLPRWLRVWKEKVEKNVNGRPCLVKRAYRA
jgi:hypothetical protein